MLITRVSPFSGETNTLDIDASEDMLREWQAGAHIQNVMPHLTPDEREFLMTGITASEWEDTFGEG